MDTLSELIDLLNKDDRRQFKLFLNNKNKRYDVKNIQLFELLETDDIVLLNKLYKPTKNRDAYHALRKRLQDSLILFLSQKVFENTVSETYDILRLIVVARFLLENGLAKTAFKSLIKAERLAADLEQYNLLNEILLLRLQYIHLDPHTDLDGLSERLLANQQQMQSEAKLHLVYAFLRRELQEIHLKGKIVDLAMLIIKTVRTHKVAIGDLMSYKSLYQILFIANEYADIQQNYGLIEKYVKRSHSFIQRQSLDVHKEKNLYHHLYILYFLANFHLRSQAFTDILLYLGEMSQLIETQKRYKGQFFLRHQLLLALNYHFTGRGDEAMAIMRNALSTVNKSYNPEDIDDLRICLAMFLAQHQDRESLRYLALLAHSEAWYEKRMGMLWTIRKSLMEILVQIQFGHVDVAASRLNSFKKRYKKYLINTREQRVIHYVSLVEKYLTHPEVISEHSFQQAVLDFLQQEENNDIFNLSFVAWLVALWDKRTPYQVVLSMVKPK
jgi:hypothetical protein